MIWNKLFFKKKEILVRVMLFMDNLFEQAKLGEAANRESCLCRVVGSISIRIDANQGPFRRSQNEI